MISEKTLHTLEFDKILAQLAEHASFSASHESIRTIQPSEDLAFATLLLERTSEARLLLRTKPSTHLGGVHDVRSSARRAAVGSILTPGELLEIGDTLEATARLRSSIISEDIDVPWLRSQALSMTENRPFVSLLDETFTDRGEMLDSASPALRRIRTEMRTAQGRLMDRLNSMVTSTDTRSSLQEPIVTMRNGRYVIPVRSDARSKVPGIVHDQSASGQTVFVEPTAVTEMNNKLKELQMEEQREIDRILLALSGQVAAMASGLRDSVEALIAVDVAFAKARYADALEAVQPALNSDNRFSLVGARHPLLRGDVVPITAWLGTDFRVLIITGPNTGGKTVALKTLGLLCVMAQSGLHVPAAAESELAVFPKIFADIGDEQSIEQSLSTFSSHMRTIIGMLPHVDHRSLVLLDELGAGTDPAEGAALARAIIEMLLESECSAIVTTHYSELKTFAHEHDQVENASVEFDVETLSPTYRLTIGLPGRSQALAIARRLGMPQTILANARQNVATGAVRVEKMLSQIQAERQEIGRLLERAKEMHVDARKLRDRVQSELRDLKRERNDVLAAARDEAATVVRELRDRLKLIELDAAASVSRRQRKELETRVEQARDTAVETLGPLPSTQGVHAPPVQSLKAGVAVMILSLGQQGTVLNVHGGEAEVQFGQFKVRRPIDDLEVVGKQQRQTERKVTYRNTRPAPPMEIDVRGWRADDALRELDQYLHDNYMHGQGTVRIVHGKGTGALRKAIRDELAANPLVKSVETEKRELGGEGVTVVKLAV